MASTSNESSPETPMPLSESLSSSGTSSSTAVFSSDFSHSATLKRLGSVWKSPVWEYFSVAEGNKFAECNKHGDMVSRGGGNARNFNTMNLVN